MSLTARQKRAARHLARGLSQPTAGARVGVSARTLRRWLTDCPGFLEATTDPASAASNADPTETLHDLLDSDDEKVRLAASSALLKLQADPNVQLPDARPVHVTVHRR